MSSEHLTFKDLPLSYRMSQGSMISAFVALLIGLKFAPRLMPVQFKWLAAAIIAATVLFALTTAAYVVIRYPYISLVETRDGDIYAKQFASTKLLGFLKSVSLVIFGLFFLFSLISILGAEIFTTRQMLLFIYSGFMFGFCGFMTFVYDPVRHPTIATLARSTLGLGLILFPIFFPIVIIGSFRLRQLLGNESDSFVNSFHEAE